MKIIAVFKTHFDIGFTHLAEEVVKRYADKMLDDVIKTCEGTQELGLNRQFVWTMASWPLLQSLKNAKPESKERAEHLIKTCQLTTHALPFTTHTEFGGLEELIRSFRFAKKIADTYNQPFPISAKMTDVPGHTLILPTLLAKAGVKFLHLGCNPASTPPDVPLMFWWEGLDGSRVLTFYNKGSYGSTVLPPKDWKYPVWLAMMQTNDNIGPQDASVITDIENEIRAHDPMIDFKVGTLDDFYVEISKCDLSDLPIIKQDLADTWIHGVGSYPVEVSEVRRSRNELLKLEKLAVLSYLSNNKLSLDKFSVLLNEAYENLSLFTEHTWGLDVKSTLGYDRHYDKTHFAKERATSESYQRIELSWDEQRSRSKNVLGIIQELKNELRITNIKNDEVFIFNPKNTPFKGYCESPEGSYLYVQELKPFEVRKVKVDTFNSSLDDVTINEEESVITMQNNHLEVAISKKTGLIIKLIDLFSKKNWAKTIGGYQYEVCGWQDIRRYLCEYIYKFYDWSVNDFGRMNYPDMSHKTDCAVLDSIEVQNSSIVVSLQPDDKKTVTEYGNANKIIVKYTLLGERLNVKLQLINKEATPIIEGGFFTLDLNCENAEYYLNKVGTVINPKTDIIKNANNLLYCVENWLDIVEGNNGLTIITHDAPLLSIGEMPLYKFRGEYMESKEKIIYINLFNNMWGTNFPQWMEGNFIYEFDLVPHQGTYKDINNVLDNIIDKPLIYSGHEINLNKELIKVENGNVLAVKLSEDQKGIIIRIKESIGEDRTISISGSLLKDKKVYLCDLIERSLQELELINDNISITVKPFEIITLYVKL